MFRKYFWFIHLVKSPWNVFAKGRQVAENENNLPVTLKCNSKIFCRLVCLLFVAASPAWFLHWFLPRQRIHGPPDSLSKRATDDAHNTQAPLALQASAFPVSISTEHRVIVFESGAKEEKINERFSNSWSV